MKIVMQDIFLKQMLSIQENYGGLIKTIFTREKKNQKKQKKKLEKVEKLVCAVEDKEKYVIHIRALKQALSNGLILRSVHKVIHFNQEVSLKP